MPRNSSVTVTNNFSKGVVTEATGLNFPENAVVEADNFVFDPKGSVYRRLGFNLEHSFTAQTVTTTNKAINTFYWKGAGETASSNFVVMQCGATLYVYNTSQGAVSDGLATSISLSAYWTSGAVSPEQYECSFASGGGVLFVAHPMMSSLYVKYDVDTNTFTTTAIEPQIRDFEGVDDSLEIQEAPTTLSDEHSYNLLNQGWGYPEFAVSHFVTNVFDRVTKFHTEWGFYPSNSEIWWLLKTADEAFTPSLADNNNRGNSPAPKGFYLLDFYDQDRATVSGIAGLTSTTSGIYRAGAVAFFAGRVWLAGTRGQDYQNRILFSQILERDAQYNFFYQVNDPCSESTFDLLPTDGGTIKITEAGFIHRLVSLGSHLLVFADNGVWAISGSQGIGFTATDYSVTKLSSVSTLSASTFIETQNSIIWWSEEGIYSVSAQDGGTPVIASITNDSIKTLYDAIPLASKRYAHGAYNRVANIVQWVYSSEAPTTVTKRYNFDTILVLRIDTGAFYSYSVDTTLAKILGVVVVDNYSSGFTPTEDYKGSEQLSSMFKYPVVYGTNSVTFADERDTSYVDWFSVNSAGVAYDSTLLSGYIVRGDGQRKWGVNYLFVYSNSDPTECSIQLVFDYSLSDTTGRFSQAQQLAFDSELHSYQVKRLKMRGNGLSCQFKVSSVSGKPCTLIGWSTQDIGNASV